MNAKLVEMISELKLENERLKERIIQAEMVITDHDQRTKRMESLIEWSEEKLTR